MNLRFQFKTEPSDFENHAVKNEVKENDDYAILPFAFTSELTTETFQNKGRDQQQAKCKDEEYSTEQSNEWGTQYDKFMLMMNSLRTKIAIKYDHKHYNKIDFNFRTTTSQR